MEKVFKIVFLDKEGKEFFTQEHLSSDEESANMYAQMMARGLKEVETFELSLMIYSNEFETKEIGGTLVFWNRDMTISGEIDRRFGSSAYIKLDNHSEFITQSEENYLKSLYMSSSCYER